MRILMITPEAGPYAQTGGLGEVLSSLPAELVKQGLEVDVFMPMYRGIVPDKYNLKRVGPLVEVDLNNSQATAGFWEHRDRRGPRYIFLENDHYYDREGLYGDGTTDHPDNSERFVFLCRSAIEMALATKTRYDVFHSHDWQAALTSVYLRTLYAGEPLLRESASVLTIHNLGYQGIFWHHDMPIVGVGWELFNPGQMEFHGKLNFLKSGIVFSDRVNTVSQGYREEILTPDFGFGLEGILLEKGAQLSGILNGVDYQLWNPTDDSALPARFDSIDLSGKEICKREFQREAGLPDEPHTPLLGMVSRLSNQKGIDLLEGVVPWLMEQDVQLALLGTGEDRFHKSFRELSKKYPDNISVFLKFDQDLAHRIFAASDMLIVPSRYEPCGLNQLYSLKYGAVPIVRATGGLNDTVEDFNHKKDTGTGFKFFLPQSSSLQQSVEKALSVYRENPDAWKRLMIRGMNLNFSWSRSADHYREMYESAVVERRNAAASSD
ncbi:glycogen synthase GlgA [Thermodesulfobacteriota bacterium]